jgi:hypothetical protein
VRPANAKAVFPLENNGYGDIVAGVATGFANPVAVLLEINQKSDPKRYGPAASGFLHLKRDFEWKPHRVTSVMRF